jgi:hypothetical protein
MAPNAPYRRKLPPKIIDPMTAFSRGVFGSAKPTIDVGHKETIMMGLAGLMTIRRIATVRPIPPPIKNHRRPRDGEIFMTLVLK